VEDIENLAPAVSTISTRGTPPPVRLAIHPSHVIPGDVPEITTMGGGVLIGVGSRSRSAS
jgi:hypothetical protein